MATQQGADAIATREQLESSAEPLLEQVFSARRQRGAGTATAITASQVRKAQAQLIAIDTEVSPDFCDVAFASLHAAGGDMAQGRCFNRAGRFGLMLSDVAGHDVMSSYVSAILSAFQGIMQVPVFAVQHMPPTFTASLAERLNKSSALEVVEARDGDVAAAGTMYIAPGGRHMVVRCEADKRVVVGITDSLPVNSCRPAVDVLFRSISMVYGGNVLVVILTGMGSDGAAGAAAIRRKGGYCIVQDEKSSVVWGMPGAVVEAGDADEIVALEGMMARITELVRKGSAR